MGLRSPLRPMRGNLPSPQPATPQDRSGLARAHGVAGVVYVTVPPAPSAE